MTIITASPIMNSKPLVMSLDVVACTDAAKANTIAKKNKITAATAPRIVKAFIIRFGVTFADLNLILVNKMQLAKSEG